MLIYGHNSLCAFWLRDFTGVHKPDVQYPGTLPELSVLPKPNSCNEERFTLILPLHFPVVTTLLSRLEVGREGRPLGLKWITTTALPTTPIVISPLLPTTTRDLNILSYLPPLINLLLYFAKKKRGKKKEREKEKKTQGFRPHVNSFQLPSRNFICARDALTAWYINSFISS